MDKVPHLNKLVNPGHNNLTENLLRLNKLKGLLSEQGKEAILVWVMVFHFMKMLTMPFCRSVVVILMSIPTVTTFRIVYTVIQFKKVQ